MHCLALVLLLAAAIVPTVARAYGTSDLQGAWRLHAIASGPGAPWWERASGVIAATGAFVGTTLSSDGDSSDIAGTFVLSPTGVITSAESGSMRGALDIGRTVMVNTDTWEDFGEGTTVLRVGVRHVTPYRVSDLAGDWEIQSIASGPGAPWWQRGRIAVTSDGTFIGTFTEIDGSTEGVAGAFGLTDDGVLMLVGAPLARGSVDAGHSVMVMTSTWSGFAAGTSDFTVGLRIGSGYATSDLAGTWELHLLATGPGAPWWGRGTITVGADGAYSGSMSESNGDIKPVSGSFALSASGVVTRAGAVASRGALDSGRSVLVTTDTWSGVSPGTSELVVGVRTSGATTDTPRPGPLALALEPVRPNPLRGAQPTVSFTLARTGRSRLELLDVAGRVLAARDASSLGAGRHTVVLVPAAPLTPGLYWVRLTQDSESRVTRVAVLGE